MLEQEDGAADADLSLVFSKARIFSGELNMKFAHNTLIAAVALAVAGVANGAALTVSAGGSVTDQGWTFSDLGGSGSLVFSRSLIGALNAGGVQVTSVSPATVATTVSSTGKYTSISAAAPVTSLSGNFDGSTFGVTSVGTAGGALQTAEEDFFTTTGGSMAITNLRVDLTSKRVFATMVGGNGVGTINNLYLWNYTTLTGPTSFSAMAGTQSLDSTVSGLTITADAFALFSQALGLTEAGDAALSKVTDFGQIVSTVTVKMAAANVTPPIPEPSTYALMGLGLAGIGLAARRRRAK